MESDHISMSSTKRNLNNELSNILTLVQQSTHDNSKSINSNSHSPNKKKNLQNDSSLPLIGQLDSRLSYADDIPGDDGVKDALENNAYHNNSMNIQTNDGIGEMSPQFNSKIAQKNYQT